MKHLLDTFFDGSPEKVVEALVGGTAPGCPRTNWSAWRSSSSARGGKQSANDSRHHRPARRHADRSAAATRDRAAERHCSGRPAMAPAALMPALGARSCPPGIRVGTAAMTQALLARSRHAALAGPRRPDAVLRATGIEPNAWTLGGSPLLWIARLAVALLPAGHRGRELAAAALDGAARRRSARLLRLSRTRSREALWPRAACRCCFRARTR